MPEFLGLFDTWANPEHPEDELKLKTRPQVSLWDSHLPVDGELYYCLAFVSTAVKPRLS
jgi:hypothetical protein